MKCGSQFLKTVIFQADFLHDQLTTNLKKYEPDDGAVFLLLSIFVAMQVVFTAVHALALSPIPSRLPDHKVNPTTSRSRPGRNITGCFQSELS